MSITKTTSLVFKTGDLAVYPAHGVGVIEGIKKRQIAGVEHSFYVLKIMGSDATIMVPLANVEMVGLRKIMKKSMIPKVYSILQDKTDDTFDNQTWNRRYREYTEKIKTGCAMEVAKVLRDLYMLKHGKELSFGERRMLDTAKTLLVKELSVAKKIKEEKVEEELDKLMQA
ncbi:CarD-like transcriptional regulator [hydrothermal vent metagenome]|uniref:CarD-like transcriptional regulator n=1 Tax=hydrothermal vent metagenome TaxID=652676 RepID=A0A3B0RHK8_9ZZZZ